MVTDEQCLAAAVAYSAIAPRIQGFTYGTKDKPVYVIRDIRQPPSKQEIWRGDNLALFAQQCEIERMRAALISAGF